MFEFVQQIIGFLGFLIPKKKGLVILGSMNGQYYGDNSKYVFEFLFKKNKDLKVIWLTKSEKVYNHLKKRKMNVVKINSIVGLWILCRADIALFTNSLNDIAFFRFSVPSNLRLISLRHGKSVKRVRFAIKNHKLDKEELKKRHYESVRTKYVISTSSFISKIQEECLQLGFEKSVITGYPRNDIFFHRKGNIVKNKGFNVLYAPSWRHGIEETKFFPFSDFYEKKFVDFLRKNNIYIFLRPHKNDMLKYPSLEKFLLNLSSKTKNILIADHDLYPDVNEILPDFDCLITDYSSLYHDYLLLDKPIIFIPYDYERFSSGNGFMYDYYKYLPGPSVNNLKEFCSYLKSCKEGVDAYKKKRKILRDKVHFHQDGKSTERVINLVYKLLKE